ncbi:MAG: ABC transporter permease [Anaerolineaceae bacterium]|nr:ABC transporter permease [Anaerolineaceae bacterium]
MLPGPKRGERICHEHRCTLPGGPVSVNHRHGWRSVMRVWTIAQMTVLEAVRRRIVLTALLLGLVLLAFHGAGFGIVKHQMYTDSPVFTQSVVSMNEFYSVLLMAGFYAVNFLCIMLAALLSANSLAGEITTGTIQTLVSKPIRRIEIVLGKWLGLAILTGLYVLLMIGGLSLSVWLQSGYLPPRLPLGMGLIYLETLLVMTVSLACSSRLSTLATGGVVIGLYGIAFVGSWVEQIASFLDNRAAIDLGILSSLVMPSEALWRRASYEMTTKLVQLLAGGPFISQSVPSPLMIVYALLYLCAVFYLGVRWFSRRDL